VLLLRSSRSTLRSARPKYPIPQIAAPVDQTEAPIWGDTGFDLSHDAIAKTANSVCSAAPALHFGVLDPDLGWLIQLWLTLSNNVWRTMVEQTEQLVR